jgi:hypothetical protein
MTKKHTTKPAVWWSCNLSGSDDWKDVIWKRLEYAAYNCSGRIPYILPIERDAEPAKALVVSSSTEEVGERSCCVPSSVHGSQTGDRDGVQPGEDVRREELVDEHAGEGNPEPSDRLRVLDALPMETLEHLHSGKTAPVDRVNMPYADRAHDSADTITKESNRDGAEDDSNGAQRHIVEEVGCRKDLAGGRSNRRRGCSDGRNGMLLQVPVAMVEEGHDCDPQRRLANSALLSPSSLELVSTWQ